MHRVVLPGTDIPVSRLAFGTASLHHLWSSRDRLFLLAAAVDMGFSHFDTAPYYGFGLAEQAIGYFLRTGKADITVATKIGLYPPIQGNGSTVGVWARKFAGKAFPTLSRPVANWSVERAACSLERSLRQLGVDKIDFLLLHEPRASLLSTDEFLSWLQREQRLGKIKTWGLAGNLDDFGNMAASGQPLAPVLQVRDSLERREADQLNTYGRPYQFSFGYLSSRSTLPVREVLRAALQRNSTGAIIVSSREKQRLSELVAVAEA